MTRWLSLLGLVSFTLACGGPESSTLPPPNTGGGGQTSSSGQGGDIFNTSSAGGMGTGATGGAPATCTVPEDCPGMDTDCSSRTCVSELCGIANAPSGTPCDDNGGNTCNGGGACISCGQTVTPPGGVCPGACTGGCNGTTCIVDCSTMGSCTGQTITCPADFACEVQCGASGCTGAAITCPATYGCDVDCNGASACENAAITCSTGICSQSCSADVNVCAGASMNCGGEVCTQTCASPTNPPSIDCTGAPCTCSGC
ncbi:MAG TPA: hypothetical protein ENK57_20770 [Polyangiaceae bacterium]|nr:hypothetical protein [Polyangiaceae bacterium]